MQGLDPGSTGRVVERRSGGDRRRERAFPSLFSPYRRRKKRGRRRHDRGGYVDCYDARSWAIAISVLLLSITDAFLTSIQLLEGRIREANPVMNAAIHFGGIYSFFSLKAAMTALPLAIIMLHKEWALARFAARLCLWSYIMVSAYHLYLIAQRHSLG